MAISEVEIKELVEAVQEKAPDYQLDWQTYLVGNLWGDGGFWLENPQYFIFIYLSKNYQAIAKKDIQGLQVENRGLFASQIIPLVLTVVAAIVGALTKSLPIPVLAIVCGLAYRFHVIPRLVYRIHPPKDQ